MNSTSGFMLMVRCLTDWLEGGKQKRKTADGVFGAGSKAAVKTLKSGDKGNAVHIMQGMLYCRGFDTNGVDGIFGSGTTSSVKRFQSSKGLSADGLAGPGTMYALYNWRLFDNRWVGIESLPRRVAFCLYRFFNDFVPILPFIAKNYKDLGTREESYCKPS